MFETEIKCKAFEEVDQPASLKQTFFGAEWNAFCHQPMELAPLL
jgi:hypothetical protein